MIATKFDLYRPEWLELVFDDRNKAYGAYDLRRHYAGNLVKAMGITFFGVAVAFASFAILHKPPVPPIIKDPLTKVVHVILMARVEPPKPTTAPKQPSGPAIKSPPMVVVPDELSQKPVAIEEYKDNKIGQETTKGTDNGEIILPPETPAGTGGTTTKPAEQVFDAGSLETMPEPYGGAAAWAKFLQKNIRYPQLASDNAKFGKVYLSFIIETDGHLSNIVVDRGVGFGLDEEALRVLKLAPAWKPGIQNGHHVRVRYTLPINFQITDPE